MEKKRFLLIAFGTLGDIYPCVVVGELLVARGYDVYMATLPQYATLIQEKGMRFRQLADAAFLETFCNSECAWNVNSGLLDFFRTMLIPMIDPVVAVVREFFQQGEGVVLSSVLALGTHIAYAVTPFPFVTLIPSPVFLQSVRQPVVLPRIDFRDLARNGFEHSLFAALHKIFCAVYGPTERSNRIVMQKRQPAWKKRFFKSCIVRSGDIVLGDAVNAVRQRYGLAPVHQIVEHQMISPELGIGLFPDWFAPFQPDWPGQMVSTAFPALRTLRCEPSEELLRFLDAGSKPLVFGFGSLKHGNQALFSTAVAVCRQLGRRGVLVSPYAEDIPHPLPDTILHVPFAPLRPLYERAALVVHHAGIGTCAEALKAGIPQLLVPFSYDQPDNATRLLRLGVAKILAPGQMTLEPLVATIHGLLEDAAVAQACRECQARICDENGQERAVDTILHWLARRMPPAYKGQ